MSLVIKRIAETAYKGAASGIKAMNGEIKSTAQYMGQNAVNGWNNGGRLAQIKNMSKIESTALKARGVIRQTKVRKEDLPALLGSAGLISPLPFGSVVGYGIGKILKLLIK